MMLNWCDLINIVTVWQLICSLSFICKHVQINLNSGLVRVKATYKNVSCNKTMTFNSMDTRIYQLKNNIFNLASRLSKRNIFGLINPCSHLIKSHFLIQCTCIDSNNMTRFIKDDAELVWPYKYCYSMAINLFIVFHL
jgi:hypothetical protein